MGRKAQPLLWAVVVLAIACGAPRVPPDSPDPDAAALVLERDALRAELELSGQDRPYLVLHLAESRLTLNMRGNVLRDYPVLDVRRRAARFGFVAAGPAPEIVRGSWTLGRLVPRKRLDVQTILPSDPKSGVDDASAMPPLPEELVAAPARYALRFDGDFLIEIRAGGDGGTTTTWRDRFDVMTRRPVPGLSVALSPEEAGALYRSLGDDIALVIRQ